MAVRERLDRRTASGRTFTAMKSFTYEGRAFDKGDPFPTSALSFHTVQTLHGSRYIDLVPIGEEPLADPVAIADKGGGNYEISAAWLPEPVKAKGKDKAEEEAARIREEGPPLGFIEGGSPVTIEDQNGGWYLINAPWLDEPQKVQGRMEAERVQLQIHAAGEPASYKGITLTPGENGWWSITREGQEVELKVQGEASAREAAAKLRAGETIEGQPAEWTTPEPLKPGDVVVVGDEGGDLKGLRVTIEKIDGENAEVVGFAEGDQSDGTDLKHGTVPLAALTRAEIKSAEGASPQ